MPERGLYLAVVRVNLFNRSSFIYSALFDREFKEIFVESYIDATAVPGFIGVTSYNWKISQSGPEDPRIFSMNGKYYVIFNMISRGLSRNMYIYSYSDKDIKMLRLKEHENMQNFNEKNWSPVIIDEGKFNFVYSYQNFQIIECSRNMDCEVITGN